MDLEKIEKYACTNCSRYKQKKGCKGLTENKCKMLLKDASKFQHLINPNPKTKTMLSKNIGDKVWEKAPKKKLQRREK